jgi:zinc/manganese transport system substrate-binding protein
MGRRLTTLTAAAVAAVVVVIPLTACTAPDDPTTDGTLRIVASTNVYGDLSATIAGPDAIVTSIIDDPSADPHGFEANPRVQLELAEADLVIANGGGYDDFVDEMLEASGNTTAIVLHAVDFAGTDPTADGFNEHVWYLYSAMMNLAGEIGVALDGIAEDSTRAGRVATLQDDILDLQERAANLSIEHAGEGFIVTEPVPQYLLGAAGLVNLTPRVFTEAIEDDTDVAPALLQQVLNSIPEASVVVVNGQTGGPQTDAVIDMAGENGVPWFAVTETLPDGLDYVAWQSRLIALLEDALAR